MYKNSYEDDDASLLQVIVNDKVWTEAETNLADLREVEKHVSFYISADGETTSVAVHDLRTYTQLTAILNIVLTLIICSLLAFGSLILTKVTQDLVLSPIESMIRNVRDITSNPIEAA